VALGEQLLQAIYADPDDLEARAVYADWLSDRGDPRGELISLQLNALRGTATREERTQAKKLLKAHQRAWLGPLAETLRNVEFRGGFPDAAELMPAGAAVGSVWAEAAESPQLSTLHTLLQGQGTAAHYTRFLVSPHTRALKRAEVPNADALEALFSGSPRELEHLCVWRILLAAVVREADWRRTLPKLKTLDLELPGVQGGADWALARLREHPVLDDLQRLRVFSPYARQPQATAREVVAALMVPHRIGRLELRRNGMSAAFWRAGETLAGQLVDPQGAEWEDLVEELPALSALEVILPPVREGEDSDPEVALHPLRRTGVEVTVRREPRATVTALLD
jgi:uncharacterized protein (TIGR02996 family)